MCQPMSIPQPVLTDCGPENELMRPREPITPAYDVPPAQPEATATPLWITVAVWGLVAGMALWLLWQALALPG